MDKLRDVNGVEIQEGVQIVGRYTGVLLHVDRVEWGTVYAHKEGERSCARALVIGDAWCVNISHDSTHFSE